MVCEEQTAGFLFYFLSYPHTVPCGGGSDGIVVGNWIVVCGNRYGDHIVDGTVTQRTPDTGIIGQHRPRGLRVGSGQCYRYVYRCFFGGEFVFGLILHVVGGAGCYRLAVSSSNFLVVKTVVLWYTGSG